MRRGASQFILTGPRCGIHRFGEFAEALASVHSVLANREEKPTGRSNL
jgi:hypothetical protein